MHKTNYALQYTGWQGSSVRKALWACTNEFDRFSDFIHGCKAKRLSDELPNFDFFVMKNNLGGGRFFEVSFKNDVKVLFLAFDEEELYHELEHLKRHKKIAFDEEPLSISASSIRKVFIGQMHHDQENKDWVFTATCFRAKKTGLEFPSKDPLDQVFLKVYHPKGYLEIW